MGAAGDAAVTGAALERLFADRFTSMVRLAALLTGSPHTAEELVMDAFAAVAERVEDLDSPEAYLRTCVVNATRSHHRRQRTARDHPTPRPLPAAPPEIDELWARLAELRAEERSCVVLRYYEDLPLAAIAEQLSMPLGTVKSHLHRGLAALRELLTAEDDR